MTEGVISSLTFHPVERLLVKAAYNSIACRGVGDKGCYLQPDPVERLLVIAAYNFIICRGVGDGGCYIQPHLPPGGAPAGHRYL